MLTPDHLETNVGTTPRSPTLRLYSSRLAPLKTGRYEKTAQRVNCIYSSDQYCRHRHSRLAPTGYIKIPLLQSPSTVFESTDSRHFILQPEDLMKNVAALFTASVLLALATG